MRSITLSLCVPALTGLILTTRPAEATLITYTDPVLFAAAVNSMTTIGFEGIANPNSTVTYNNSTGLTLSGVQFTGLESATGYVLSVVNPGSTTTYYDFGSSAGLKGPNYDVGTGFVPYLHILLPANVTAFAVDLMTISPNALSYQASVSATNFTVATANRPTRTFFGVTSDSGAIPFVNLTVLGTSNTAGTSGLIDNVQFGAADPQPPQTAEACTLLLIGSGLAALGYFRKRLKPQMAAA